jgi:YfiH family protein
VIERVLPDWPVPRHVRAFTTTREGGVSRAGWRSLNLGDATGDDPAHVAENRARFEALLPAAPGWIRQVHGFDVVRRETLGTRSVEADAVWTATPSLPCTVLTADCLPVLFTHREGTIVAAAHAGWRGLAGGVLESTLSALPAPPSHMLAWIGPGIGVDAYEVGASFRDAFRARLPWLEGGFVEREGRVHADLEAIARAILARHGVTEVHGGGFCTYTDRERFFSHRRQARGGRMATTIWIAPEAY